MPAFLARGDLTRVVKRSLIRSGLQDRNDALPTGSADGDEAAPATGLLELLGQRSHDAPTGGGEGVSGCQRGAVDVQLAAVDGAEGLVEAEARLAEVWILPRLERCEHGRGESLVNLIEVEVLQAQTVSLEETRHGIRRRDEQPLVAVDVVDGSRLGIDEPGERRQTVLGGPVLAREQH